MNPNLFASTLLVACVLFPFTSVSAQESPEIINPETGAVVNLTRAYWDANTDIANRKIQCDFYSYNVTQGVFEETGLVSAPQTTFERTQSFIHQPLPDIPPHMNRAQIDNDTSGYDHIPLWGVVDGVYAGVAPLAESEFVEIVTHRTGINDAVRVWYPTDTPSYHVCYAIDGEPFIPTGSAEVETAYVQLPDFTFATPELDATTELPVFTNLETGETVQLMRGEWSYNQNVAFHLVYCSDIKWYEGVSEYATAGFDNYSFYIYHPYDGGDTITYSYQADINVTTTQSTPIAEMSLPFFSNYFVPSGSYVELTGYGYRVWNSNEFFKACTVRKILSAQGNAFSHYGEHVYSDFGAGTFKPLRQLPFSTVACDYTDADSYDGWGWNSVFSQPCPPLFSGSQDIGGDASTNTNGDGQFVDNVEDQADDDNDGSDNNNGLTDSDGNVIPDSQDSTVDAESQVTMTTNNASDTASSGGGCTTAAQGAFDPLFPLIGLLAVSGLRRQKRKSGPYRFR